MLETMSLVETPLPGTFRFWAARESLSSLSWKTEAPWSKINVMAKITPNYYSLAGLPADIVEDFSYAHFYDGHTLLVRFLGTNPVVEELLESVLGGEFADGNSVLRC